MKYEDATKVLESLRKDFIKKKPNLIAYISCSHGSTQQDNTWTIVIK